MTRRPQRRLLFIADVDPYDEADIDRWCDQLEAALQAVQVERDAEAIPANDAR